MKLKKAKTWLASSFKRVKLNKNINPLPKKKLSYNEAQFTRRRYFNTDKFWDVFLIKLRVKFFIFIQLTQLKFDSIYRTLGDLMFNPKQLGQLMKQAQSVQENFKKAQEELASITVEGNSGAGLVRVSMTCKNQVLRVFIDQTLLTEDKSMLEDLIAAAMNDASRKAADTANEKMAALSPGMPNLGGMGLPSF